MYFKQLRTREEQFSQLKKNKDTLQGKIDSAEKKLAKMSPEHKDLATWTQKLSDLRNEMVGMENAVINEEAAIGDYRRQTARSAVSHQVRRLISARMQLSTQSSTLLLACSTLPAWREDDDHWGIGQALDLRDQTRQDRTRKGQRNV